MNKSIHVNVVGKLNSALEGNNFTVKTVNYYIIYYNPFSTHILPYRLLCSCELFNILNIPQSVGEFLANASE